MQKLNKLLGLGGGHGSIRGTLTLLLYEQKAGVSFQNNVSEYPQEVNKDYPVVPFECCATVNSAQKFDYMVTFVTRMGLRVIFITLIEVGSIKYFKARMSSEH